MKLPSLASIGQNIQFVAFMAHVGIMYSIIATCHNLILALTLTILSAIKEYWYDAKYEINPPQTWIDNTEDFIGYAVGIWLAWWIM